MVDYPKHLPAFSYTGEYRYFLTFCTYKRQPLFKDAETVAMVCGQFLRASGEFEMDVVAYCFMPDHVHLVVEGREQDSDLKRFVFRAKQYAGYYYRQAHGGKKLRQRYGFEHVIRDDEKTQTIVRYVLENPVRQELVSHPREYPFLGSFVYGLAELLEFAYGPG